MNIFSYCFSQILFYPELWLSRKESMVGRKVKRDLPKCLLLKVEKPLLLYEGTLTRVQSIPNGNYDVSFLGVNFIPFHSADPDQKWNSLVSFPFENKRLVRFLSLEAKENIPEPSTGTEVFKTCFPLSLRADSVLWEHCASEVKWLGSVSWLHHSSAVWSGTIYFILLIWSFTSLSVGKYKNLCDSCICMTYFTGII